MCESQNFNLRYSWAEREREKAKPEAIFQPQNRQNSVRLLTGLPTMYANQNHQDIRLAIKLNAYIKLF